MLALAAGALTLGGCASAAQSIRPAAKATPTSTSTSASGDPRQIALADAQKVIASLGRIPGAVRLSQEPAALRYPNETPPPTDPDGPLQAGGWYSVSAPYKQALAEASAILHAGAPNMTGTVKRTIQTVGVMLNQQFADARGDRYITVSTYELTAETSALAIGVTDDYRPAKTAAEDFPAGGAIDAVFGSVTRGTKPEKSLQVTDQQTIAGIAKILNALPTVPLFGASSCPAMPVHTGKPSSQHEIDLTFRRSPGGTTLVHAVVYQPLPDEPVVSPCLLSGVVVDRAPELDPTGHDAYAQVAALLGLTTGS